MRIGRKGIDQIVIVLLIGPRSVRRGR